MVEIGLIICSLVIASKFRAAEEEGAVKYILGIWGTLVGFIIVGGIMFAATDGLSPTPIIVFMLFGYVVAIGIAIAGIRKGNFYLRNKENAQTEKTSREFEALRQEMEELKKSASPTAD